MCGIVIVCERENEFVMIKQHDHAHVSAEIARHLNHKIFVDDHKHDIIYSIQDHDRGWIDLDHTPLWNDRERTPFSFMDFPLLPKLAFYRKGIDEVEEENKYATLLCSLHFVSFFENDLDPAAQQFISKETERQKKIKSELDLNRREDERRLDHYFDVLQFCDNLSLYICLNEPGVKKSEEISWYRKGFPQLFTFLNDEKIVPQWLNKEEVCLSPFPLERETHVSLKIKEVEKESISTLGIAEAYQKAPYKVRQVTFTMPT
jgi:hypothetical protein